MSSDRELFVYVMVPGSSQYVTAGRFRWALDRGGRAVGRFRYSAGYLERSDAVPLDPIELRLGEGELRTARLGGLFGAFRDASPDYWGRRIIERRSGRTALTEVDYLLESPDDRAGALGFGLGKTPPPPVRQYNRTIDLERLQAVADELVQADMQNASADHLQAEDLLLLETSMGGARPKAVVEWKGALWLAKFNRSDDRWNSARVERAMLELARECGINAAITEVVDVGGRDVLLVRRFDREHHEDGYHRARMVSALTLLRGEDDSRSRATWSYPALVEEVRRASAAPAHDAAELFRRMCFNALISNIDDHPRNHAMIAPMRDWRLSPAYDLTPSTPVSLERRDLAMICGDEGRYARRSNLLSQCRRFLLEPHQASECLEELETVVRSRWRPLALKLGVSEVDCDRISGAFVYPGF